MSALAHVVRSRPRDLGGFEVRRVLPWGGGRMVGPFIFLDQMGPVDFAPGHGIDVRAHPHIGLATVTYLYEGEMVHRDSLGVVQAIRPGDVNWMTAGRGIVHSERTPDDLRARGHRASGLQTWVALPVEHEETEPAFFHHAAATLPQIDGEGTRLRLIAGTAYGRTSPVHTFSGLFYVDAVMYSGARLRVETDYPQRAVYVAEGEIDIDGEIIAQGELALIEERKLAVVRARDESRLALLGGDALERSRHIWWNFVSSSPRRIEQAKRDWSEGRFAPVPGESEFIPLPPR
jgi:redox-sensitive bicupin YhaK (pirin superfamily)